LCICKVGIDCKTLAPDGSNKCVKEGWKYDPVNISIVFNDIDALMKSINADVGTVTEGEAQANVQFEISFTPIKIQNVINGRTRRN
jgi:hypothetical protein